MFKFSLFKSKVKGEKPLPFQFFNDQKIGSINISDQRKILKYAHKRSYKAGETIFLQGDPATGMYILAEGEIEVLVNGEVLMTVQEQGTLFGLFTIDADIKRWYSLRAASNVKVYGLFKPDFETIFAREPKLAFKITRYTGRKAILMLAELYKKLNETIGPEESLNLLFKDY